FSAGQRGRFAGAELLLAARPAHAELAVHRVDLRDAVLALERGRRARDERHELARAHLGLRAGSAAHEQPSLLEPERRALELDPRSAIDDEARAVVEPEPGAAVAVRHYALSGREAPNAGERHAVRLDAGVHH